MKEAEEENAREIQETSKTNKLPKVKLNIEVKNFQFSFEFPEKIFFFNFSAKFSLRAEIKKKIFCMENDFKYLDK